MQEGHSYYEMLVYALSNGAISSWYWCWCWGLCYSPPFDVIFRSDCQCCLEIKTFLVLKQIVPVYWILSECQVAGCSTGLARTQINRANRICQCWCAALLGRRDQYSEVAVDVHLHWLNCRCPVNISVLTRWHSCRRAYRSWTWCAGAQVTSVAYHAWL